MTGFYSKRGMVGDKVNYEQFYQHERTKLINTICTQMEQLGLEHDANIYNHNSNKEIKQFVAQGYKMIMEKENTNA